MVIPAQRFNFDVLAQHIESHFLHGSDIAYHRRIRRRSIQSIRPIALIQHTGMEIRLAVQEQARSARFILLHAEFAHAEIAFHAVLAHAHFAIIKVWMLRRPWFKPFHADSDRYARRPMLHHVPDADNAGQRAFRILWVRAYFHGTFVKKRGNAQGRNILRRHAFAPNGLPNSALRRIPYAAALALLFPAGMEGCVAFIAHTHSKRVFPFLEKIGRIK